MSKETFLSLLRQHTGEYLSGESVSETLGLSRAAIWKYVEALRGEGYEIEARRGLGYRLLGTPDALTEAEIRGFLPRPGRVGQALHCFSQVNSTNTYAKKIALEGAVDGSVVIADEQTAGCGRMERPFHSPAGKGIYLSALLRPQLPPIELLPVTALSAVAVCNAVEQVCGLRPQIKWTNDLILGKRKLGGILTEMALEGESARLQYLVIGIGLNVLEQPEDFPPDLREVATSLSQALGRAVSRPKLAAAEIRELDRLYTALENGELEPYRQAYRRDCVTLGKEVQILRRDGSREQVTALDIDEQFGLVVRTAAGQLDTIRSGEVSVRGMYGYIE